jgi:TolA-binding protein
MPVQRCEREGEQGWQYGDTGKCYLASEEGSDDEAKRKAYLQGAAIEGGGPLEESKIAMAELMEVPILKRGRFNGMEIADVRQAAIDTMKALPYLLEAQRTGKYRGEKNARFNTEPVPPFIHLLHKQIAREKVQEWAAGVSMAIDTRLINGEEWAVSNFSNVDRGLAELLAAGFPGRSVEILPNFENPDTGEIYPVVIRSVAFLDANTMPAVPQYPGYSVKLAENEMGVQTVSCGIPQNQQSVQGETVMSDKQTDTVKLSAEDIQRFEAMNERLKALEGENKVLKGAVNEMEATNKTLASDVQKFQQQARQSGIDAFCAKLERDYNLTPVAIDAIRPVLSAENGVVKMSADADPVPTEQAYMQSVENILKLAKDKDALFVPEKVAGIPTGKQSAVKPLTKAEQKAAAIAKFSKDESGNQRKYADALSIAANDPAYAELFKASNDIDRGGE